MHEHVSCNYGECCATQCPWLHDLSVTKKILQMLLYGSTCSRQDLASRTFATRSSRVIRLSNSFRKAARATAPPASSCRSTRSVLRCAWVAPGRDPWQHSTDLKNASRRPEYSSTVNLCKSPVLQYILALKITTVSLQYHTVPTITYPPYAHYLHLWSSMVKHKTLFADFSHALTLALLERLTSSSWLWSSAIAFTNSSLSSNKLRISCESWDGSLMFGGKCFNMQPHASTHKQWKADETLNEILLNDLAFLVNLFKGIGHLIIVALGKIEGIASQYTADLQLRGTHFLSKIHGIPIATSAVSCCTHSCFHEPFFEQVWFLERFLDKPKGIMLEKWFTVCNMSHASYRLSCAILSKWCFCKCTKAADMHTLVYNCTTDVRVNVLNKLFQDKRPFRANTSTGSLGALFGAMVWPRLRTTGALAWDFEPQCLSRESPCQTIPCTIAMNCI